MHFSVYFFISCVAVPESISDMADFPSCIVGFSPRICMPLTISDFGTWLPFFFNLLNEPWISEKQVQWSKLHSIEEEYPILKIGWIYNMVRALFLNIAPSLSILFSPKILYKFEKFDQVHVLRDVRNARPEAWQVQERLVICKSKFR